jgi:hypothetical protein
LHGVVGAAQKAGLSSFREAAVALKAIPRPQAGRVVLFGHHLPQGAQALSVVGGEDEAPGRAGAAQTVEVLLQWVHGWFLGNGREGQVFNG